MSDTEDQLILEDIRALEDALSRKTKLHQISEVSLKKEILSSYLVYPSQKIEIDPGNHFEPTCVSPPIDNEGISKNPTIDSSFDSAAALELNQKLIERLIATRNEVTAILEECKRKRADINMKIKQRLRVLPNANIKVLSSHAGMPYFKDKDFFASPANEDTKLKEERGQLQIIHLRRVSRWTVKDKEILLKAIHHEVIAGLKNLNEEEEDEVENMTLGKSHSLPAIVLSAIGRLGQREFDWMKIAVMDFQNKHSPEECRVMWNVFLHPDINKFKWKKKELSDLHYLADKYKYQNWEAIAKNLGTQRSGYQCFVKYNTTTKTQINDKPWAKKEDTKLVHLVNKFKIGDFINWGDIASCMTNRTKQQIYFRWMYSLAPHLKKGRFTDEEDQLFMNAIEKYGLNFKKISALVLPARTSAQLSDHYNTIINSKQQNVWTIEQDSKLLTLYDEYGNDWAKISTFFDGKSRVQLRHRHSALLRYHKRGIALNNIPRDNSRQKLTNPQCLVFQKVPIKNCKNSTQAQQQQKLEDVDQEIIDYFHKVNVPPSKAGRKQKYYQEKELESIARKMHNLLQFLNAKLNIPYDLDDYDCLSEKDKQLLQSLKNLSHDSTYGAYSRKVEQTRLFMFGFGAQEEEEKEEEGEEDEHFIPALPFGTLKRTDRVHQLINCDLFIGDKFLQERKMTFETPCNVIEPIGEDVDYEFDKLGELFIKPTYKSQKQIMNSIYVLSPDELERREMVSRNQIVRNMFLPSTSKASNSDITVLATYQNNIVSQGYDVDSILSMKPNYWTLLGYQQILIAMKEMNTENNVVVVGSMTLEKKIREKGRIALDLLKMRLVQLFKYPIIMSQVMPPESSHEEEMSFKELIRKRKINYSQLPTRKRKKNQVNNIS